MFNTEPNVDMPGTDFVICRSCFNIITAELFEEDNIDHFQANIFQLELRYIFPYFISALLLISQGCR